MIELSSNMWQTLKKIALNNKLKLAYTFGLVAIENVLMLTYPIFAGYSVNAILNNELVQALSYAFVVLVMWGVGATRRAVDTRTFARIYANLAVPIILNQRQQGQSQSAIAARATLSREFVDFFEMHLPMFVTSLISLVGAVLMLIILEFWVGIMGLFILAFFLLLLPKYTKKNDQLYFKLNNRLEKEVDFIGTAKPEKLIKHYDLMAKLRIKISNREAFSYAAIGISVALLFSVAISAMVLNGHTSAGHIYSVMTYLWMFAISLDDGPRLIEEYSKLKDVGTRVNI